MTAGITRMRRNGRVSRRELLTRAGLAGTALLVWPEIQPIVAATRTLSPAAFATLHAICARIIPTDELGPGATEAHAAEYIDRALGGALGALRREYRQGLASVDRAARQAFGAVFSKLTAGEQDRVLTDLQNTPFFGLVRGHTLQGTFCDPVYGGNAGFVGWDLLGYPGVRLAVLAADQNMSTPASNVRASAYASAMFSKTGIDVD